MREVVEALTRLATVLQSQIQVTTLDGARGSTEFKSFIGDSISGTTSVVVWTPNTGRRFRLRGFAITAIVKTTLVSANPGVLYFFDSSSATQVIAPVGSFAKNATQNTIIAGSAEGSMVVDLQEGVRGTAVNTTLKLGASLDIGAGEIRYCGVTWGVEETS